MTTSTLTPPGVALDTRALRAALTEITKVVPARSWQGPLRGVRVRTDNGRLLISGTDHDTYLAYCLDFQNVHPDRAVDALVDARHLLATVRLHDQNSATTLRAEDGRLAVAQARRVMRLPQLPADHYPPDPDRPGAAFELTAEDLAAIARDLVPVASTDDTLPALTCVRLHLTDGQMQATATDRYRMAFLDRPVHTHQRDLETAVLVPASAFTTLRRVFGDVPTVTVGLVKDHLAAWSPDRFFVSRLIDAQFPNTEPFRAATPADAVRVSLDRGGLLSELKAVALACESNVPISLDLHPDHLTVRAGGNHADEAHAESTLPLPDGPREPITVWLNPTYLADALGAFPDESVDLTITSPLKPITFTAPSQPGFRHLLMPVHPS